MALNVNPVEPLCQYAASATGFNVDQTRYIVLMALSYLVAVIFRHLLHPDHTSLLVRYAFSLTFGLLIGLACFGWAQMAILFFIVGVSYLLLYLSPTSTQRYSMVWAMGSMSATHIYRMVTDYGGYHLDFTGPLMVLVQKITLIAYALHDGKGRKQSELNPDQLKQKIDSPPGLLQYLCYMFNFHSFLAGPTCTFKDFRSFMDGSNLRPTPNHSAKSEPSSLYPVLNKLVISVFSAFLFATLSGKISNDDILDPQYRYPYRHFLNYLNSFRIRTRYYFIWLLSDSISNCAGLGFAGYDDKGNAKWDLVSNINIMDVELGTNIRTVLSGWNALTSMWLRRCVYERVPYAPTLATLILSAWWHGFYPGYYFCFIYFAFYIEASRKIRRLIRHYFQSSKALSVTYDILTILVTQVFLTFGAPPLDLMWASKAITYWSYYYYIPAICVLAVTLTFPSGKSQKKEDKKKE